jgi:magnesium and cobalt transporter
MMEGAIAVADLTVGDVMVSRSQMVSLPIASRFLDLMKEVVESGHSRFPVHGENKDEILGILLAKDLLRGVVADNGPGNVRELLRPAVLIPESKKLNLLLKEFRLSRNHMAIVVDEYGGVAGLVTIEDVLEQIVGEIDDEHDDAEEGADQIAAHADGRYVVDALTPISDFNERFGADFPDDEYDTVGGLVTAAIGHLPDTDEELTLGRFEFRVAKADARRVHAFHVGVLSDS